MVNLVNKRRRHFLTGLGGITFGLPWLEAWHGRASAQAMPSRPKRIIAVTYTMGIPTGQWRPSAAGETFTLPYVTAPLEKFKSRCLFVSGLDHVMLQQGGDMFEFGHPAKSEAALTGTLTAGAFPIPNTNNVSEIAKTKTTKGGANGPSVEQVIGKSLFASHPRPSVDLGIDGDRSFNKIASRFFFESRGAAVSMDCSPRSALAALFANLPGSPNDPQAMRALMQMRARKKSVLDAVRDGFTDLQVGLGTDDRRRLSEHAARIRQIELDMPLPLTCMTPADVATEPRMRLDQISPLQIRILAQAMACQLAPIGRLEFLNLESPRFGIPTLDGTLDGTTKTIDWHGMVHGDPLPGTQSFLRPGRNAAYTTYDQRLLDGYRFFVQQFAALMTELDRIPEGQGTTVLDNSMLVLASDFGDGLGHYHGKMGYILAGHLGAGRRGYHHAAAVKPADGHYGAVKNNVSQLLNSMVDMAGVTENGAPLAEFGLQGLFRKINKPRRIDELFTS